MVGFLYECNIFEPDVKSIINAIESVWLYINTYVGQRVTSQYVWIKIFWVGRWKSKQTYNLYIYIYIAVYLIMFIVAASIEAHQSSTNGSFVADLGCDGDLDTFSLTNNGENQWWSTTLTKTSAFTWVYIRIKTGIYS